MTGKKYSLKDIYSYLVFHDLHKEYADIERELRSSLSETNDDDVKEELLWLLTIIKIKNSSTENAQMLKMIDKYQELLKKMELTYKTNTTLKWMYKKKNIKLMVFYNIAISRLYFLSHLYQSVFSSDHYLKIDYLQKEFSKDLALTNKHYWTYFIYLLYKWWTGYGNGFINFFWLTLVTILIFAVLFFGYDLMYPDVLTAWFPGLENTGHAATFEYYIYQSTNILSNLWADTNLATTPYLRLLFEIEQLVWVILFWVLISLFAKKL